MLILEPHFSVFLANPASKNAEISIFGGTVRGLKKAM